MNKDKEVEAYKSGNLTLEEQTKYEIAQELGILDRKSTRLNSSHSGQSRMPSSA